MHHPEPDELRLLQTGNQPQHASLLAPLDLGLKPDEAEMIAGEVVLPELDDGVGFASGARVGQPDGLHRAEAQRLDAARGHDFDRQAPFEEPRVVELVERRLLGGDQRGMKPLVLVTGKRTVQIVPLPVIDAAGGRACPRFP